MRKIFSFKFWLPSLIIFNSIFPFGRFLFYFWRIFPSTTPRSHNTHASQVWPQLRCLLPGPQQLPGPCTLFLDNFTFQMRTFGRFLFYFGGFSLARGWGVYLHMAPMPMLLRWMGLTSTWHPCPYAHCAGWAKQGR